jgi:hypothetical protein
MPASNCEMLTHGAQQRGGLGIEHDTLPSPPQGDVAEDNPHLEPAALPKLKARENPSCAILSCARWLWLGYAGACVVAVGDRAR